MNSITRTDIINNYENLCSYLVWFHAESSIHNHEYQPSDNPVLVFEYVKVTQENLILALQDIKKILQLDEFPAEAIIFTTNYQREKDEVYPWFLSIIRLLAEEAIKQDIEIPQNLKGLWKQKTSVQRHIL